MKQILFFLAFVFFYNAAFSQNCPQINGVDVVNTGPGSYELQINCVADGQKHIVDSIFSGNTFISTECISIKGSGTYKQAFTCPGVPRVVLIPGTGTCINGATCGTSISFCPSCGALPITLSEFSAAREENKVLLSWQTQTELNSRHFVILSSFDKLNFEVIGTVNNISANSSIVHNYSFVDNNNGNSGLTYYKLKIVDIDGRFTYSDIKVVRESNSGSQNFVIYPNPATTNSNIIISGLKGSSRIQFLDNAGRIVKTASVGPSGKVDISGLRMGIYFMVITDTRTGQSIVKKLSVVNP